MMTDILSNFQPGLTPRPGQVEAMKVEVAREFMSRGQKVRILSGGTWKVAIEDYLHGVSACEISRRLGVSKQSVLRQVRSRGFEVRTVQEVNGLPVRQRYVNGGKLCPACGSVRPLSDFYVDRGRSDGLSRLCRACFNVRAKGYMENPSYRLKRKEYQEKYRLSEGGKLKQRQNSKKNSYTVNGRFLNSRARAKRVGKTWTITKEQYVILASKACEYCGGPLPRTSTGLDRLNNSAGYEPCNVVPCCAMCNYARRDQFTPEEMRRFIGPAVRRVRLERGEDV
jgi:hypothetical protein